MLIPASAGVFRRRFVLLSFGVPLRVVSFLVILAFRLPGAGLVLVFRAIFGLSVLTLIRLVALSGSVVCSQDSVEAALASCLVWGPAVLAAFLIAFGLVRLALPAPGRDPSGAWYSVVRPLFLLFCLAGVTAATSLPVVGPVVVESGAWHGLGCASVVLSSLRLLCPGAGLVMAFWPNGCSCVFCLMLAVRSYSFPGGYFFLPGYVV